VPARLVSHDSKATNADAAARRLASFSDIFWIAAENRRPAHHGRWPDIFRGIGKAYLIGEAAGEFAAAAGQGAVVVAGTLDRAVELGRRMPRPRS